MFNYRQNEGYYPRQMHMPFDFNRKSQEEMMYSNYFFRPDDTIDKVALKYFTTPYELIVSNNINPRNIYPGLVIKVPLYSPPKDLKWYEVKKGDTLWKILEKQGMPRDRIPQLVKEIGVINQFSPGAIVYPTENILIPIQIGKLGKVYVVKSGDTLDSISINQDVGIYDLFIKNKDIFLLPGQELFLPEE